MNHDQSLDDIMTWELRDSLSDLAPPGRPPLASVTSRGRAHQRRRAAGAAGFGVAGVAAGTAVALGLTGVLGPASAPGTGTAGTVAGATGASAHDGDTIQTAAFTLTSNANGTDTLTLNHSQMFDPATLQRALAAHGIPALVKTGAFCVSSPPEPEPTSIGAVSIDIPKPIAKAPELAPIPIPVHVPANPEPRMPFDNAKTVISPAAIPAGTELFFGYFNSDHAIFFDLINTTSYTCGSSLPPASS